MTTVATTLSERLDARIGEIMHAASGVDEDAASRRPAESNWCAKEILSHLCGDEGEDLVAILQRVLDEDEPLLGIVTGLPYYTPARQKMTVADLLGQVGSRYGRLSRFLDSLTDEQLQRTAHLPVFKDTSLGNRPTLAQFLSVLIDFHLPDHINQLRTISGPK
jgi:hypothetical protein